jgi:hypothetical protein
MKIVPFDKKDIRDLNRFKNTKNQKILQEFIDSGLDCVKVEDYTHKSASICCGVLRKSAERFHMNNIEILYRGDSVYLIRKK